MQASYQSSVQCIGDALTTQIQQGLGDLEATQAGALRGAGMPLKGDSTGQI